MQRSRASLAALVAAGLFGCAPAELRRHSDVAVSTSPAGASCLLTGGAEPVAGLPSTPAVVRLPQSPRDLRVFCTAPGHAPVAAVLPVEYDRRQLAAAAALAAVSPPMYAASLLGAARGYPPKLDVALPPVRFASAQERDAFFAARAAETRRHFDRPVQAHKTMCRPDEFGCQHMIAGMERARDEELARLETLRAATPPAE